MTKKQLLETAKKLKIQGRHGMDKEQLEAAIKAASKPQGTKRRGKPVVTQTYSEGTSSPVRSWNKVRTRQVEDKLPKQLEGLLTCAAKHEGKEFTLKTLGETAVREGYVQTKQDPARIAYWYRPQLERYGAIQPAC